MEDNNKSSPGIQIELKPSSEGVYANLRTYHTFKFRLCSLTLLIILPGLPKPEINSRVIMAPEHAKRLLQALQENV